MKSMQLKNIVNLWPSVSSILSVPHSKKAYVQLCKLMDEIIDEVGNDEKHPLSSLLETIGLLIVEYEDNHYPMESSSGINALKYLINEHGLKQSELNEIGSQGVVSEILNGKRELNIRQIKLLSKKFSVSPSVFL